MIAAECIGLLRDIGRKEPEVTASLVELGENRRMHGLEFRLKSPASLARKLQAKARQLGATEDSLRSVADKLSDVARYTVIDEAGDVVGTAKDVYESMITKGARLIEADHSYVEGTSYKGLHMIYETDGVRFEVQVHTEQSQAVKDKLHLLYEEARVLPAVHPDRARFEEQMRSMSASIEDPPGIADFTQLGDTPVERRMK